MNLSCSTLFDVSSCSLVWHIWRGGVLLPGAVLPQVTLHKEGDYTNSATMQLQRVCFQNAASTTDQLLHRIHYTFCHLAELGGRPKLPINAKTKNYCFSYLAYIYINEKRIQLQIPHSSWAISLVDVTRGV